MFLGASRSASEADSARLARSCWSGTRRKGIPRVPPLPDFLGGSLLQRFFLGDDDDSAETTQPEKTRGGGDTAAAAAAASRAAAAHLATQWVRFLFLQPLLIRHALRKTKDVVLAEPPSGVSFPALLRALLRRPFVLAWGGRVIRDAIGDRCSVRYGWLYGRGGPPVSPAPRLPGDTTRVQKRRLPKSTGDHPVR